MNAGLSERRIPGLSRLFGDYLYEFDKVARFYPAGAPFDLDRLTRDAAKVTYPAATRRAMATALDRQNEAWGVLGLEGETRGATRERLQEFAQADAVAIVTGQQVGLFGGPLLAVHKAMTAVLLAERLRARGIKAVPIFWMATQDHDLAEVNQAWALDPASQPTRFEAELEPAPAGAPVGGIRLHDSITALLDRWEATCGGEARALRASYQPGATLGAAFARLLLHWFAPWGLIVFDPFEAPEAAALWRPYYLAAFDRQPELAQLLAARAAELQSAGYHAQVEQTAAASMLFFHREGVRLGLRRHHSGWLLGDQPIAEAEARAWIAEHPEHVSPAALLRPLLQDVAFPTLAQVTGPAETAYLAQSAVLFQALAVRPPVAYPRVSATIMDAKARRLLDKYNLTLDQIWHEPAAELLARRALPPGAAAKAQNLRTQFDREFAALAEELHALDPTLVDAAQGAVQKIRHQLEQLEARVARSHARRSGELTAQAQHLAGALAPNGGLQERLLATASLTPRYPDLLARLFRELDVTDPDHQIADV